MGLVHRLDGVERSKSAGVVNRLAHLSRLELELGLAETRETLVSALVAAGVAFVSVVALIAAVLALLTGAIAPFFGGLWQPHMIVGGLIVVVATTALAGSLYHLRHFEWPTQTLASVRENWRWLGAQLRSRLISR